MALTTTTNKIEYLGNGVATTFVVPFKFISNTHMFLTLIDVSTLVETPLSSALYTITGAGTELGGTVTYSPPSGPMPSTTRLRIERIVPYTQDLDIRNQSGFFPAVLNQALDSLEMQLQQQKTLIDGLGVSNIQTSVAAAAASASSAAASAASAAASYDNFDDRYLGAKASAPTVDNDGNALVVGALYYLIGTGMHQWSGSSWVPNGGSGGTAANTTEVLTGTDATKFATSDAIAALWEQGASVASAATVTLGEGGYFNITGAVTITDIDFATDKAGRWAWLRFASALTLTHSATLPLPGAADITVDAGATALFISEGADVMRCVDITRGNGRPLLESTSVNVATTSGTSVDIPVPSWAKTVILELDVVATNGSGGAASTDLIVQIGPGSTPETTTYASITNISGVGIVVKTTGFGFQGNMASTSSAVGTMILTNITGNRWKSSSLSQRSDAGTAITQQNGGKTLAGLLGVIRLTTPGNTNTFTGGSLTAIFGG